MIALVQLTEWEASTSVGIASPTGRRRFSMPRKLLRFLALLRVVITKQYRSPYCLGGNPRPGRRRAYRRRIAEKRIVAGLAKINIVTPTTIDRVVAVATFDSVSATVPLGHTRRKVSPDRSKPSLPKMESPPP